jgi:hypothetical protein
MYEDLCHFENSNPDTVEVKSQANSVSEPTYWAPTFFHFQGGLCSDRTLFCRLQIHSTAVLHIYKEVEFKHITY